jgi:hypothetical protein
MDSAGNRRSLGSDDQVRGGREEEGASERRRRNCYLGRGGGGVSGRWERREEYMIYTARRYIRLVPVLERRTATATELLLMLIC